VPFLRLTRDRRGFENTFLMHADGPGDRPRVLYWYRTAPGILLGRPALDEDAIRTIEEQHPDIEFDWPAILALSEVMIHEEEAPQRPPQPQKQGRRRRERDRGERPAIARQGSAEPRREEPEDGRDEPIDAEEPGGADENMELASEVESQEPPEPFEPVHHVAGLLEELAGREIATRLRGRHAEIMARIHEQDADEALRDAWVKRAEPLNPDLWLTPHAILEGVRNADALFEQLRRELLDHSSRE
jgi:hypothetical protein